MYKEDILDRLVYRNYQQTRIRKIISIFNDKVCYRECNPDIDNITRKNFFVSDLKYCKVKTFANWADHALLWSHT